MERFDWVSGLFWLFFSCLVGLESYRLGIGTLHKPGPGFLFFWTSVLLGILSFIVLYRAWKTRMGKRPGPSPFHPKPFLKIVLVLASVFLYAIFMEVVGFILDTFLLFFFLLGIIERKRWPYTVLVSLTVTGCAYLIFEVWLKSQLPKGILASIL